MYATNAHRGKTCFMTQLIVLIKYKITIYIRTLYKTNLSWNLPQQLVTECPYQNNWKRKAPLCQALKHMAF